MPSRAIRHGTHRPWGDPKRHPPLAKRERKLTRLSPPRGHDEVASKAKRAGEMSVSKILITALAVSITLAAFPVGAEPYAVGDRIAAFTLEDQHGEAHTLSQDVTLLLFSRDMDGGDLIEAALAHVNELPAHHTRSGG